MDSSNRTTTLGIVLIMALFFGWLIMTQPKRVPTTLKKDTTTAATFDSSKIETPVAIATDSAGAQPDSNRALFSAAPNTPLTFKRIETPIFIAEISSKGANLRHFILKNYKTWNKQPLDLVNQKHYQGGDVNLRFVAADGKVASTKDLAFTIDPTSVTMGANDSISITATYLFDSGKYIQKTFHFRGNNYLMGIQYDLVGMQEAIAGYHYNAVIENALPYAEEQAVTEATAAKAFAGVGEELEEIDAADPAVPVKQAFNGDYKYVGTRTRYFISSLLAVEPTATGADLSGSAEMLPDENAFEKYTASLTIPVKHAAKERVVVQYYLGPLEYERMEALGLTHAMDFGWSFLVRPISVHMLFPLFMWLRSFISNWGVVIIVFSVLIKLVTLPLTNKQMYSMRKMQVLNPKVMELREKYKEDPQKMNEELLKIYRTYGVNPAGGCLPLLLQMPILFALYSVLSNVIELRQAPFIWWITDLSAPDVLFSFGFSIPLLGSHLSGLTILLTATTFLQQMFTVTDPRQKSMMYIMSFIFVFMFNGLPSGVALYYFVFNIMGLIQQFYLMKIAAPIDIESMKVDPKKGGGGLMGRLQNMEKKAREQRSQQYTGKQPAKQPKQIGGMKPIAQPKNGKKNK